MKVTAKADYAVRAVLELAVAAVNFLVPFSRGGQPVFGEERSRDFPGDIAKGSFQRRSPACSAFLPVFDRVLNRAAAMANRVLEAPKEKLDGVALELPGHKARPATQMNGQFAVRDPKRLPVIEHPRVPSLAQLPKRQVGPLA